MCIEEKFIKGQVHPLQAVGWEGFWGMITIASLLYPLSNFVIGPRFAPNTPYHTLEDVIDGLLQMKNDSTIIIATVGNMISIALFNFFSISVTKNISAVTRMVLDSMRTVVIWSVSLGLGWQKFIPIQLFGLASLILGTTWFNKIMLPKFLRPQNSEEDEPLLDPENDPEPEVLQE